MALFSIPQQPDLKLQNFCDDSASVAVMRAVSVTRQLHNLYYSSP